MSNENKYKIFVGSLGAYNNGEIVGGWLEPNSFDSYQSFIKEIENLCNFDKYGDEWMIQDYDGLPSEIGEYPDLIEVYDLCHALKDIDDSLAEAYLEYMKDSFEIDTNGLLNAESNFVGIYDSFNDFSDSYADEILDCTEDNFITRYFDYESFARDLEYDYTVLDVSNYQVAIFNN